LTFDQRRADVLTEIIDTVHSGRAPMVPVGPAAR
jgi:hypothetical protein